MQRIYEVASLAVMVKRTAAKENCRVPRYVLYDEMRNAHV